MIYPVKLEFKIYPSGAWEDWSMYLSEPPSINRKVESENPGEAGLIVFDNASVSLYYDEGSSVYAAFQETQLISVQRYLFRISLPKSNKTYVQVFEGMADFSTIEWPDKSRLISFDIIDKLSAISLVGSGGAREKTVDVWERCGSYDPAVYQIAISRGGAAGNYRRFYVDIVDRGYPEYSDCSENAFLPGEVIEYNGEYCQIVSFQLVSTGAGIDPYDGHPTYYYERGVITALHTAAFSEIPDVPSGFKIYGSLFAGRNINVIENGSLTSFDAFEIIAGLMNLAWEGTQVINRIGDGSFKLPVEYFAQLMSGSLFNKQPLDALKMLADSMQAYIFFDKNGSLVIQKKISLAVNEATCSFGNTRVIDASKKYFWDKLIDGVTITVQGWTLKNGETLVGKSALAKTNPETGGLVKPKNELSKDVLGGDPGLTTQEALDAAALQMASSYMNFYGSRHNCREYDLDLDDNTLSWDLLDNILIETEKFFFESINIDPAESKVSVKLVGVQEHDYDLRQVVVGLSSQAYTASSAGGSYSSGGTSYTGNPYLWDGGAIGLDAAKARTNLGLQNILNLGEGIIGNTEFNALDGVTSNIQTQLNSKENVLTFVGPLVRSGQQISFSYNASNLKIISGSLNTIQDINPSATPQFNGIYAGFADLADGLLLSGVALADSVRNVYAARIGIGGDPDFIDYVFKTYGNGHFTGNLFVNGTARVERLGLGTDADASLSLKTAAGAYINGNLTVVGNIYQSGTAYLVDAQHLQVESNIIYVNKNEAGNGVTNGIAGIEVERGTGTNYQFMFQESDDTFRLGMAGSLQAAATRQDSPISQGVAYWNNTVYRFDTSSNLKFDGTHLAIGGAALADALNVRGNILQDINYKYSSLGYFSGWGNKGFELNTDASGVSNLIVDNLTVRRTMSVYELLIRQIRATNGNLFVTADAKVEISGYGSNSSSEKSFLQFEDATGHNLGVFKYNDILLVQKLELDGSANLKYVFARVNADYITQSSWASFFTDNATKKRRYVVSYSLDGVAWNYNQTIGQWFEAGDSVVRIGNFTDTARQGSIYLASDDDGAPFIDVRDGVNSAIAWGSSSTKVRLGKMTGIAGNPWGNQNVYGLYADVAWLTDNVMIGGRALGLMQGLTALFHFDDNLRDSISGINASYSGTLNETSYGLVTSSDNSLVYSKVNGKFGGGAAIDSGTTNLITNGGFEAGGSTGYSWWGSGTRSIVGGYHGNGYYMESTASAVGLSSSAIAAVSGTTYTIQVKVKGDHLNYFYILKASGNVNISALATKTYLEGGWYQLTYTVTCSVTETWNILFAFYNYAKGIIDEAQVEARATATTFCEGARPIGKLVYPLSLINKNKFTIKGYFTMNAASFYVPIVALDNPSQGSATDRILLSVYNSQYLNLFVGNTSKASVFIPALGRTYHFSLKFDGTTYTVKIDNNVVITHAAPVQSLSSAQLELGCWMHNNLTYYALNGCLDEIAIFNRDTTDDEDARIFYANQPLQESPGMTYISGNKIRTGYIYSENWKSLQTGMMIGLNSAYMEMNFAEKNVFMFDSASATASIAGWGFTNDRLSKVTPTKAIYLISASDTTDLFGLQIDLQYGGGEANKPKWLSVGRIRRGQTVTDNYGFGIFDKDGYPYFESSISAVDNSVTNIMAGWKINASAIWVGGTAPATDGAYAASGMTLGSAGYLSTPNTYITSSGIFYTKSANIAGWSIDASAIYSGTRGANGAYTTSGMTIGSAGYISSPNTFISSSGVLYSKSGNIAGYSFDAGKFYVSTDFVLDAANKKLYFNNKSMFASTAAGVFLGLDSGVYKFAIGSSTVKLTWDGTALSAVGASISGATVTGTTITGSTITGGTVQTAASGQRVVLSGADNKIIFYSNNGWGGEIYTDTLNMHYMTANHHVFDQSVIVNNGSFIINDVASRFTWGNKELPVYHGARVGNNVTIPPEPTNPRVGDLDWENNTSLATKKMRMYTPDGWKTLTFS